MYNEIAVDKYKEMYNQIACCSNTSNGWQCCLLRECLPSLRKALDSIFSATKMNNNSRNSNKPTLVM